MSTIEPRVGALFRVLVSRAGIVGEFIPGGILINPLEIERTSKKVMDIIPTIKMTLDKITLPPSEESLSDKNYIHKPNIKPGFEQQYAVLSLLLSELGDMNNILIHDEKSLKSHTDRVINNITSLTGLALSYTYSIKSMGVGLGINSRVDLTEMDEINNSSSMKSDISLGGANSLNLNTEKGFPQIPNVVSPEIKPKMVYQTMPELKDIGNTNEYGEGFNNTDVYFDYEYKQKVKAYEQISNLNTLLASSGISNITFPTNIIMAEMNTAKHCEEMFSSIMPVQYGGKGHIYLNEIDNIVNFMNVDLFNYDAIQSILRNLRIQKNNILSLIGKERSFWGEENLKPFEFSNSKITNYMIQMSRCSSIIQISQDTELQGILAACISQLALEILRSD